MTMGTSPLSATLHGLHTARRSESPPRIVTNGELLRSARTAPSATARNLAADALRRRIRSLCAAVLARNAPSIGSDDLDDMVQDVLVRLLANPEITEPSMSYIQTIAQHLLIDRYRRRHRRGQDGPTVSWEQLHEETGFEPQDCSENPERQVVDKLSAADLLKRLQRHLRPREMAVFIARADGRAHEEIAAELGLTNAHVRKIWERTQSRVRELVPSPT